MSLPSPAADTAAVKAVSIRRVRRVPTGRPAHDAIVPQRRSPTPVATRPARPMASMPTTAQCRYPHRQRTRLPSRPSQYVASAVSLQGGQHMTPLCPNVDHRHPSRHVLHDPWRQCQPPHDVVTPVGTRRSRGRQLNHDVGANGRQRLTADTASGLVRPDTSRPPCPYREASTT